MKTLQHWEKKLSSQDLSVGALPTYANQLLRTDAVSPSCEGATRLAIDERSRFGRLQLRAAEMSLNKLGE